MHKTGLNIDEIFVLTRGSAHKILFLSEKQVIPAEKRKIKFSPLDSC